MSKRLAALPFALAFTVALHAQIDPDLLAGMKARSIGPAAMSGRVASIDAVQSDPDIVYVGAATGGVWKSTDGALSFTPIFDDQPVAAIGSVAVFQPSPEIVWVGTGEGNVRNSMSVGNGVYRSTDAGVTWQHVGLDKTERIPRIVLHPTDPNIAWAAALGQAWGQNAERGVFKTTDGGKSWTKVLFVNDRTGAADLVIDPVNPNKLFASLWEYRRWPWFFNSGGPGSGLYVSYDGGTSWKKSTPEDGMPEGNLGRIGIAIAPSDPRIVYALVEAEKSALLRSDDGGRKWTAVNTEPNVSSRPFYYADLRVDPADPNRVYNIASLITVSNDGGKTFGTLAPFAKVHPDYHAMWIDPKDATHLYVGNDGGVAESRDRGRNWRFVASLPLGQYYHVAVDNEVPYNVYGGMQDNGSWKGPNTTWETTGIRNWDWQEIGFGDGFATMPVQTDPMIGFSMSQEGFLMRWNIRTGERKDVRPSPRASDPDLRFNWNSAMAADPFNADGLYFGSQYVHKSADRGETWTTISPDLTTNRKDWQNQAKSGGLTPDVTGAENFTTIIALAASSVDRNVLWAGTDDGRVHVTRDGGATWTSVEANLKGVPANTWVPEIKASRYDAGTAFLVMDNHRRSDWTTYAFRTTDFGKTWTSLVTKDVQGYAHAIEQDPVDRDLLFLGTEFGLWVSVDAGRNWMKWKHGFPTVAVTGIQVHPRDHDLVVATHGRSAYVIDDIRPLRNVSKALLAEPVHMFEVPEAQQHVTQQKEGSRFLGDAEFRGENEPYGALLTYSLNFADLPHPTDEKERARKAKERETATKTLVSETGVPSEPPTDMPKGPEAAAAQETAKKDEAKKDDAKKDDKAKEVQIEVSDAKGTVIRKFKGPAVLGVNRTSWDLSRDAFKRPTTPGDEGEFRSAGGPEVPPGLYTVKLKFRGSEVTQVVKVLPDPREKFTAADREAKYAAVVRGGKLQETATEAINRITRLRADIDAIATKLKKEDASPSDEPSPLVKSGSALKAKLDAMELRFWTPPTAKGILPDKDVFARISYPLYAMQSSWDAPTAAQLAYLDRAEKHLRDTLVDYNKLFAEDVAKYREAVRKENVLLVPDTPAITAP